MEGTNARPDSGRIALGCGRGKVRLDLSNRPNAEVLLPPKATGAEPVARLLAESLSNPVGSAPLCELAAGKKSVTIAIPDRTRPPIARDILPLLIQELAAAGVPSSGIEIFISCGIHSRHSDDDIRPLVGDDIFGKVRIHQNDGRSADDFVNLGSTSRGTPVEVNRVVADSDLVIPVGGLAFHYFAGFTGGRKMIIPGAASVNTVENNHRLTLTETGEMNPGCRSGALRGNPVHEDMLECVRHLTSDVYLVNVVRDGWGSVAGVVSGDIVESHESATGLVRELFECRLAERCDVAVASAGGHPLDADLIQSHKSLEHAAASVRDGGVVIGLLACEEGIGSDTFLPWFSYPDSREVTRNLYENYELNGHTALSFMQKRERLNMILVTDLTRETVEGLGVSYAGNLDEALSMADAICGEGARMYVLPRAWGLLPVVGE